MRPEGALGKFKQRCRRVSWHAPNDKTLRQRKVSNEMCICVTHCGGNVIFFLPNDNKLQ